MRLFIAINIPERSRSLLDNRIDVIRNEVKQDVKWVNKENWHLTMKFLGEVNQNRVKDIENVIDETAANWHQFPVQFNGIGAFPHLNHPGVFYIDINKGSSQLIQLQSDLENKLSRLGFSSEGRKYIPHLTIFRSRNNTDYNSLSSVLDKFKNKNFINVFMQAEGISLMESKLKPAGPIYKEIFTANLK